MNSYAYEQISLAAIPGYCPSATAPTTLSNAVAPTPDQQVNDNSNFTCMLGYIPTGGVTPYYTCTSGGTTGTYTTVTSSCTGNQRKFKGNDKPSKTEMFRRLIVIKYIYYLQYTRLLINNYNN